MQDEIVARLAGALNAQLVAAEARRAEQAPNPDSMDLCFQGAAWFYKGPTPNNLAQARSFFDRALAAGPDNVDALIGSAAAHAVAATSLLADPLAAIRTDICGLDLSIYGLGGPPRALPDVNMHWIWTEISLRPIPSSDMASFLSVARKKQSLTLPKPCA